LTNFGEIQKRIKKLALLIKDSETGEFAKFTKKEALKKEKEIIKLKKYYQGLLNMFDMPKAIVVVDAQEEKIAVDEAKKIGIPVISISNTDNNISEIDFPIVANDRSRSTIKFIIEELFSVIK
jgi:small subunit ribosomal protein S2